jgi:hypothetical protein
MNRGQTELSHFSRPTMGSVPSVPGLLRHLKTTEDLHNSGPSPRTESLVAAAVVWAGRIMQRIDYNFNGK